MANEITFSAALRIAKDGADIYGNASKTVDLAGNAFGGSIQNVGTIAETLAIGDVSTIGYVFVKNLDPTNFVFLGLVNPPIAGNAFAKLLPGEFCFLPTRQATIYAIADTAACDCQVISTEL